LPQISAQGKEGTKTHGGLMNRIPSGNGRKKTSLLFRNVPGDNKKKKLCD
jgi:hypothetical protein